jgi:lysophospholipase
MALIPDNIELLKQSRFCPPENWDWGFRTVDDVKIRYGQPRSRKAYDAVIVILGGLGDFGEQYFELANHFESKNLKPIVIDMPGQGGSSRYLPSTPMKRHSQGFDKILSQLHTVFDDIALSSAIDIDDNHKRLPVILLAHSMGGHIALRYLAEYNSSSRGTPIFSACAMTAPMTGIRAVNSVPVILRQIILGCLSFFPQSYVPGGCDWFDGYRERPRFKGIFSSDPERSQLQKIFFSHPDFKFLTTGSPTNKWLLDALSSCKKIVQKNYLSTLKIPILIAIAGDDKLVDNQSTKFIAPQIKSAELLEIHGSQHEILMEKDVYRQVFIDRFFTFISDNVLNKPDKGKTFIQ